ncbi:MAG: DUF5686 and carboxypeptidase regulatory-like domain-containing protein [Lentimicrobiaceae bacterium]|nr:DUF5686 and carboxypeptidase regulatory-like domain-containing protein [Lentimicrobiaceae bacterium]
MKKKISLCLLLIIPWIAFSQQCKVSGKVIDDQTHDPLAFVNIVINKGNKGDVSDIDGKFNLTSSVPIQSLHFSYVGYKPVSYEIGKQTTGLRIELHRIQLELSEVVIIPGANPAHRIILNALNNKEINDPEKLKSFSYTSYEKFIFEPDIDSVILNDTSTQDTTMKNIRDFLNKQHLFMMENVVERMFISPDKNREKVTATRISGLSDPLFVFLISQVQSTSFYKEIIKILDKNYVNPISNGCTSKYFYQLEDTLYSENHSDTTFVISFRPFRGKNFDGLKGLLYINSNKWAIQNVIASPATTEGSITIKIQQKYELVDGKHWFPVQLNTDLTFLSVQISAGKKNFHMMGKGKSYIRDIVLNPDLVKRKFDNIEVEVAPNAAEKPDTFWNNYRVDSLTSKEKETYRVIDSIGKAEHFDRIVRTLETLLKGRIPYKFLDFDLNKIARYNPYEGLYLGLGAVTNARFSRRITLGGYWGYGFADQTAKYGGEASWLLHRKTDLKLTASYINDLSEAASCNTFSGEKLLADESFRNYLIKKFDRTENKQLSLDFLWLKYLRTNVSITQRYLFPTYPYAFSRHKPGYSILNLTDFHFTEVSLRLRYAYHEKFLQNIHGKISLGTQYPIVWLQFTRGFDNFLHGEYPYGKVDIKIEKSFFTKYIGTTSFTLMAGLVQGDVPYSILYNGHGSYHPFTLYAPCSFATMRMNEFAADRYAALYVTHNFGKLLLGTQKYLINPEFELATGIGFGELKDESFHRDVQVNSFEKGYYESGLLINKILDLNLYSLGFGFFYRYGHYSFEKTEDNAAWKLTLQFPL